MRTPNMSCSMARTGGIASPPAKKGVLMIGMIIIDSLPHEDIWKAWSSEAGTHTHKYFDKENCSLVVQKEVYNAKYLSMRKILKR